jgi:uncharacterized membrane protein
MTATSTHRSTPAALAPLGLLLFSLPVILVSAIALWSVVSGTPNAMTDAADTLRHARHPLAFALHISGGIAMLALGIVQITPVLRRRFPRWHRWSGRVLVLGGFAFALTGLGLNASTAAMDNSLAYDTAQTIAALALMACLTAGVLAIRRKSIARHRVWMARAYALALGAATQTIALLPVFLIFGPPTGVISDTILIAAWPFNLAVAEYALRKAQT